MTIENWFSVVSCIIAGLATSIPLICKLVQYIRAFIRERNWGKMLNLIMTLMKEAEGMFEAGADKKEWVMNALDSLSDTIDYDIDKEAVSAMIDALCAMSKVVNAPNEKDG